MEQGVAVNIGMRFEGFKFFRFSFIDANDCDDESLGVQLSVDIKEGPPEDPPVDDGKKKIFVKVTASFICEASQEVLANIECVSLFGLEGVPNDLDEQGQMKYPDRLLTTLVSLAISTTRGAILAKGAGSFLERLPLPIVDPKGFVEKMKLQEGTGAAE